MSVNKLSIDILQLVLGCVDDKQSIVSCTLVSKTFAPIGQAYLFEAIKLSRLNMVIGFTKFLQDAPRFGGHVRNLHLKGEGVVTRNGHRPGTAQSTVVRDWLHLNELEAVLLGMPRLEILFVERYRIKRDNGNRPSSPLALQRLVLVDIQDASGDATVAGILALVDCFSEIQELILHSISFSDEDYSHLNASHTSIHSVVYEMAVSETVALCEGLVVAKVATQSIDIIVTYWDEVEALAKYLQLCGPSVKRFVFDIVGVLTEDNPQDERIRTWECLSLASCTNLESLILYFSLIDQSEEDEDEEDGDEGVEDEGDGLGPFSGSTSHGIMFSSVCAIMATASPNVRDVTFRIRIDQCDAERLNDKGLDYEKVQDALGRFENLRSVTFEFEEDASEGFSERCQEIIEEKMSATNTMGLLRFEERVIERSQQELLETWPYPRIR
ncbi:hypothetical protein EUX98_g3476 [Antrodiella citrinella]|uniref:F-box domain-containing protein n=1 Tax=Antrodiella citrinella TaxID=2447956 RepID=A0A4S4MZ79_9APHY|nr:hypothetical protein EUX98_g3476 [Antrodiella citrinella]